MRTICVLLLAVLATLVATSHAASTIVTNLQTSTQINAAIAGLNPGDTLLFSEGTYANMKLVVNVAGTSAKPIIIGSVNAVDNVAQQTTKNVVIQSDPSDGTANIVIGSGAAYVSFKGLQIEHTSGATVEAPGVKLQTNVHHVSFSSCVVKDITGIGIEAHDTNNVHDIEVQDSAFYNIGLGSNNQVDTNLGSGISAGGYTAQTSNTYNFVVKNNIFHDLKGYYGSAVHFLQGLNQSTVQDNVVWNCPNGAAGALSGKIKAAIYAAGGDNAALSSSANIVVKGNAMLDSSIGGTASMAMHVGSGTNAYNNLIYNAVVGINIANTASSSLKNTRCSHNTVFKVSDTAMKGTFTGNEDATFVVANNAMSVGNVITGLIGYSWQSVTSAGTSVVVKNYYHGQTLVGQLFSSTTAFVSLSGNANTYFTDATGTIGSSADFMCTGQLINSGSTQAQVTTDFDNNIRFDGMPDSGCYEAGSGAHFQVNYDYKVTAGTGGSGAAAAVESAMINALKNVW